MTLNIRSVTVTTYSSYIMFLGKYSSRCRNFWRSTKYDWFFSSSIGCWIQITLKYFNIKPYRIKRRQIGIYRQKKKIILSSYMTADYIGRLKSGHQCSETFVNVFVFFTPHLHQRIGVFTYFCLILARLPWFSAMARLGITIPWKMIFQQISKFPYFSFSSVCFKIFISFKSTVSQTKDKCYGTEKWWY